MAQCPISTNRGHTDAFAKMRSAILNELKKRSLSPDEDPEELALALAVIVADELEIDIYR